MRTSKQESFRSATTCGIETLNSSPVNRRIGQAVGTLLGWVPGISRPRPTPTVSASSRPNCGDRAHDRAGPSPVTLRQPDISTPTGRKP